MQSLVFGDRSPSTHAHTMDDRARPELYAGYVGAHCPSESHAEHMWRSESKQNPSEIPETKITLAFGSWTLPVLVEQCEDQELDIRRNAMRVLCESCLTTPKRVVEAVEAGAVEALARLVSDADADVRLFVSAALLLVAKSATGKRALMGTIQSVAPLLDDKDVRVRENAYGALLAVCSTCDGLESVVAGFYVPIFCGKARAEESRIQPFCLLCLYHCLKEPSGAGLAQALGESAVAICIALLEHDFHVVRHRAADLLALLCFSVEAKLAAIAGGAVEALAGLLQVRSGKSCVTQLHIITPGIYPLYTFIAVYAPICTLYTCIYTTYTPYIHHIYTSKHL